MFANERTVTT